MAMTDTEVEEGAQPGAMSPSPAIIDLPDPWPKGTDHKFIGSLFVAAALLFLVAGVALSFVMRAQLSSADATVVGDHTYRQLFTMHGVMSVFLFLLPIWLGLGSAIVPLQIGAARLAFPRLHAMAFWIFLGGGAMVVAAPVVSDVFHGWALSDPIPVKLG